MQRLASCLGPWVIKYRWWIIFATVVMVAFISIGMRFLSFNMDNRIFFSKDNPQLMALETLENTYVKNYNVFFVLAPKGGDVFERQALAALEELTEASWQIPYSSRVDSIINYQHTRAEEDDLIVESLVEDAIGLSDKALQQIKDTTLSRPMLVDRLISPSGHVAGVNVNILLPGESQREVPEVASFVRQLTNDIEQKYPNIDIHITGALMIDNGFGEITADDMSTLIPLMFLVLVVITGVALRSFSGTFATVLVIFMSMLTGLGAAGWMGLQMNTASAIAPIIILTLAIADSVHILVAVFHKLHEGKNKAAAVASSIQENLYPVFLTSITTVIGFLTMNFSDAPPFRELGNIVAIGVTAAFFYSVLFLPAAMAVLPMRTKSKAEPGCECECGYCSCGELANFVINNHRPLFWGSLTAILLLAAGVSRIELNDDMIEYIGEEYEIRRASDFLEQELSGGDTIEFSLSSGESGGINNPEYLATIEAFARWYRQQPKVVHVDVFTDIIKRLNLNMHGDDETWYRIPEQRDLAAQYLLLYEMSLPYGLDLNNQINVDKSASRMIVSIENTTAREQREIEQRGREWLKANAPEYMFIYGSGLTMMWAYLSQRNINSMLGASFGALILISLILIFALRSVKHGLISLIPNLAPSIMAFGLWGMFVGQVGLGLSVIVSMTLGIVVDDTVHFLSKYLHARRDKGMNTRAAVRHAFNTVGTAMWVTTVALVAGFLVLVFSGFKMNADMGLMTAITITLALAMDFLFLPTLLIKIENKRDQQVSTRDTESDHDN
ncbi:MMPL family transporter [Gammaproteobacteria bacterium]|nr:MMPL family transporter [Gammaproteobacteria bacterium]